eukprot:scaffold4971_cov254-Pinguiococcus_pyrenoidosus.AAC.16
MLRHWQIHIHSRERHGTKLLACALEGPFFLLGVFHKRRLPHSCQAQRPLPLNVVQFIVTQNETDGACFVKTAAIAQLLFGR